MNALQEHIEFSSHYIRQGSLGLEDPDERELLKPLGSMQVRWHHPFPAKLVKCALSGPCLVEVNVVD